MRIKSWSVLIIFLLIPSLSINVNAENEIDVYVTYSTCSTCPEDPVRVMFEQYIRKMDVLSEFDSDIQIKTIDKNPDLVEEITAIYNGIDAPLYLPKLFTLVVSVNEKYVFVNHVSPEIIYDFLKGHQSDYDYIIVYMREIQDHYTIFSLGETVNCTVNNSLSDCLKSSQVSEKTITMIPIVILSGVLDGLNPCAFTVILFLIAFLLSKNSLLEKKSDSYYQKTLKLGFFTFFQCFLHTYSSD